MEVVDEVSLYELLRRELPLVVFETIAAIQLEDVEAAARAKNNLIVYMVSPASEAEKTVLSALLSAVEAVIRSQNPCRALTLARRALELRGLVGRLVGLEAVEAIEKLYGRLRSRCGGRVFRTQGPDG